MNTMETLEKYETTKKELSEKSIPIFIVDDDPSYLYALAFYLKKNTKCKIYCYESGEECLQNMKLKPRIIILDYYLGNENTGIMNGAAVLKRIKTNSPETKVIMLSGQETLSVATDLIKEGAFTYVIKDTEAPVTIRNIVDTLCK